MQKVSEYIESGILELYVMGSISADEAEEVEKMMVLHPEIQNEVHAIELSLEKFAQVNAVQPPATVKPLLLATIDYMQRLGSGEAPVTAPVMNAQTTASDFAEWINRNDFQNPENVDDIHVKLIAATPQATTAIVWIRYMAPDEVHHDEHEKFFILEGTCNIIVDEKIHSLKAGDYFEIPLHSDHRVEVTSATPCKVILQRVAA
jgi:mannose-6-phosphate isomerase-like protein (cupin superfamily)